MYNREYDPIYLERLAKMEKRSVQDWKQFTQNWRESQKMLVQGAKGLPLEERSDKAWKMYEMAMNLEAEEDAAWFFFISLVWNLSEESIKKLFEAMNTVK